MRENQRQNVKPVHHKSNTEPTQKMLIAKINSARAYLSIARPNRDERKLHEAENFFEMQKILLQRLARQENTAKRYTPLQNPLISLQTDLEE